DGVVTNTVRDTVSLPNGIVQIAPQSKLQVTVFPNPFSSLTHFMVNGASQKFDFELFDLTGRIEKRITNIQTGQFDINRDGLAAGVYLYRITMGTQAGAYGKVVIQ